jgi:hypothetical protein
VDEKTEPDYDLPGLRPSRDLNALISPLCGLCATVRVWTDRVFKSWKNVGVMRLEYTVNRSSMKEIGKCHARAETNRRETWEARRRETNLDRLSIL